MKHFFITIILLLNSTIVYSQDELKIDTVMSLPGIKKDVAFTKASEWIAKNYNSAKDVVQLSDKDASTIICKGMFPFEYGKSGYYGTLYGYIYYTLTVKFKDEKMRVTVNSFKHETQQPSNFLCISLGPVNNGPHPKFGKKKRVKIYWQNLQLECNRYAKAIAINLQNSITNIENDDNW
ncbi:DUF4468 domain-containing protein [Parabacteroides johnsonii]|uniref:DUF4468 domain-containing protein n=1 Tax=Parabacteroides johnsonii TaxID=387661 RepID=UPI0024310DB7|nr:DUF4468 domain-containing protein [Parabacteroides johnsonii]